MAVVDDSPEPATVTSSEMTANDLYALANEFCTAAGRDYGALQADTCESAAWFWGLPAGRREYIIEVAFGGFRERIVTWARANLTREAKNPTLADALNGMLTGLAGDDLAPFSTLIAVELTCLSADLRSRFPFEQFFEETGSLFLRSHALECLAVGPRSQDASWLAALAADSDAPLPLRRRALAALARAEGSGELDSFLDGLGERDFSDLVPGLREFLADRDSEPSENLWAKLVRSSDERTRLLAFQSLSNRGIPLSTDIERALFEAAVEGFSRRRSLHAEFVSGVALDALANQPNGQALLQEIAVSTRYPPELRIRALAGSTPTESAGAAAIALIPELDRVDDVKTAARVAAHSPRTNGRLRDAIRSWVLRHPNERSQLLDSLGSSRSELLSLLASEVPL